VNRSWGDENQDPVVNPAAVQLTCLRKSYGRVMAIDDVSLRVERGEFFSLLGPSGCGKTTTLRAVAGLIDPDAGKIEIMSRDVTSLPVHKRNIGMVFQSYALFPHMTVAENIGFGLRMRGVKKEEIAARVERALDLVRLGGTGARLPRQLSGGQQQRVAFARAVVIEPQLLLLDEPLSNLDAKLRKEMQIELRALQRRLGITAIYVTHDQEEALTLSDRIAVMNDGRIAQCAEPSEIYRSPSNRFVAEFIGRVNVLPGRIAPDEGRVLFQAEGASPLRVPSRLLHGAGVDGRLNLVLRPENIQLDPLGGLSDEGLRIRARILQVVYAGATTSYVLELSGGLRLMAEQQNTLGKPRHGEGEEVDVYVDPEAIYAVSDS
jgi:putative spermidine/putrescine transport system ATP-binding protein